MLPMPAPARCRAAPNIESSRFLPTNGGSDQRGTESDKSPPNCTSDSPRVRSAHQRARRFDQPCAARTFAIYSSSVMN